MCFLSYSFMIEVTKFSVFTGPWSKLKIVTIQWIKSRIWDTIDDWYLNNLAKNQVSSFFHSRVICRSVPSKFIELCMKPRLCPSEGHGRIKSNKNICHWVLLLKRKIIALQLRDIERNVCSSTNTVHLAKTKVITHLLTYSIHFSGLEIQCTQFQ